MSSIRDGYTARVVSDAEEKRNRHLVNNSDSGIAPVFRKASEEKSLSQLLEHLSAGPRRGTPDGMDDDTPAEDYYPVSTRSRRPTVTQERQHWDVPRTMRDVWESAVTHSLDHGGTKPGMKLNNRTMLASTGKRPVEIERPFLSTDTGA